MIPQPDFITAMFNVELDEIETLETFKLENTFHYHIKLKLKRHTCPYCGEDRQSKISVEIKKWKISYTESTTSQRKETFHVHFNTSTIHYSQ